MCARGLAGRMTVPFGVSILQGYQLPPERKSVAPLFLPTSTALSPATHSLHPCSVRDKTLDACSVPFLQSRSAGQRFLLLFLLVHTLLEILALDQIWDIVIALFLLCLPTLSTSILLLHALVALRELPEAG